MTSFVYLTKNIYTTNPILLVKWFLNNLHSRIVAYQTHLIIKYGCSDLGQSDMVEFFFYFPVSDVEGPPPALVIRPFSVLFLYTLAQD